MSRHEIQVPLWDVVDAGERILRYTEGKTRTDYDVWADIQNHLPLLLSECRSILGELPA